MKRYIIFLSVLVLAVTFGTMLLTSKGAYTADESPPSGAEREFTTDFSKHSVPYSEVLSGGPPKDGIPPIDNPTFVDVADADGWLVSKEPVLMHNFYPNDIFMDYPIAEHFVFLKDPLEFYKRSYVLKRDY